MDVTVDGRRSNVLRDCPCFRCMVSFDKFKTKIVYKWFRTAITDRAMTKVHKGSAEISFSVNAVPCSNGNVIDTIDPEQAGIRIELCTRHDQGAGGGRHARGLLVSI